MPKTPLRYPTNKHIHTMIPLITNHTDELAEICRRHHVKRLEVFGSAAVGDFDPQTSDIDFLVDFGDAPLKPRYGNHIDLKEDLENLFNRTVDVIDHAAIKNSASENPSTKPASRSTRRDPKSFLWDIQQSAHAILEFTAGKTFPDYEQDRMPRTAVEREFSIIGEATNRLQHHDERLANLISNHRRTTSLRNTITRRNDDVRNDLIWTNIQDILPTIVSDMTNFIN